MFPSAEVRWFWHGHCPRGVHKWFFKTGLPPGGGCPRIDRYFPQANGAEIGIKERGDTKGLEIKGLVATRRTPELIAITNHVEIWCKWSCTIAGLKLPDELTITKKRWFRKFDTSAPVRAEVPLDSNENPKSGSPLPVQGCNVELTEVTMANCSSVWWTLGFEAFGDLDIVPINLSRVVLPERAVLAGIVSSGKFLSYPAWLLDNAHRVDVR